VTAVRARTHGLRTVSSTGKSAVSVVKWCLNRRVRLAADCTLTGIASVLVAKKMAFRASFLTCILLFAACAVLLTSSTDSVALLRIDFDQRYFHEPGWVAKDFAFFKADSVFHLFYTRVPDYHQLPLAADSIGHATSLNLKHWTVQPPVIAVEDGWFEGGAVWAPYVMENPGGGYLMFYTCVDSITVQRIGIATSEDLFTWTKHPGNPVFRPDTSWADWDSTVNWSSCRDPHIFYEDGTYYMLVTAATKSGNGAIGSAVSTDLFNWTDNGPIYVHSGVYPWHAVESCFLMKRDDKYRLFFSEEVSPPGTSYMASDSLYSGWDLATRQVIDPGIAPEILDDGDLELFSRFGRFEKGDTVNTAIKVDTLRWVGDDPSTDGPHPLIEYWAIISGDAVFYQPTFWDNSFQRGSEHCGFQGNSWIGTLEYSQGPLQNGWSGWSVGENAVGYITSYSFVVEGDSVSLLVGGGNFPDDAFVALYRTSDDSLLFRETGNNTDAMDRRIWHVEPLKGVSVYLKIVDNATGPWGHINCDEILEFFAPPDTVFPWANIVQPNGGDTLVLDEQYEIRWQAGDDSRVDSLVLEYSVDGGLSYPYVIARPSPQDSTYLWTVPDTYSDSCLVRLTVYDIGLNSVTDESDSLFTIVEYIGIGEEPATPPSMQRELALCVEGANPFAGRVALSFSLPHTLASGHFSLDVFDVAGRHVRNLAHGQCPPTGTAPTVFWNACDETGRPVGSGIYLLLLRVRGEPVLSKKLVVIR